MNKIIVIDDDPNIRNLIKEFLGKGYDITETDNVDEVVNLCKQQTIDLVITDLFMPKSGLGLIENIKKINKDIKILAISGASDTIKVDFLPMAGLVGADETLVKPFSMAQLRAAVSRLLETSKNQLSLQTPLLAESRSK